MMVSYYLLSIICVLVIITPAFSTSYIRVWKKPQLQSYDSIEYDLPYAPPKLADRTNMIKEQLEQKDKILTLLTKEKEEVSKAEAFLSAMLRVLHNLFAEKPGTKKPVSKDGGSDGIAWSYYDDIGK